MKKLCKYYLEMHRSSDIEGVFIMTDEELELVKEITGYEVYYGEISGKHSEVRCVLDIKDIEILSEKKEEITFFEKLFPHGVGFCFKDYWFSTDQAYEDGYEAGTMKCYKTAEEALKEFSSNDNSLMREMFFKGFKQARE